MPMLITLAAAALVGAAIGPLLMSCIHNLPRLRPITAPVRRGVGAVVVGLLTAAMFAGALWLYGPTMLFVSRVVLGCALFVLFAIDFDHRLLPNAVTLPGIAIGLGGAKTP